MICGFLCPGNASGLALDAGTPDLRSQRRLRAPQVLACACHQPRKPRTRFPNQLSLRQIQVVLAAVGVARARGACRRRRRWSSQIARECFV